MKICLIGEYTGNLEEGMRKTAFYLGKELSNRHQVLPLDIKRLFFRDFWQNIKKFNPQIIHYIPGPSIKSFIIVKVLAFYCKDVKTIMSATHPTSFHLSKKIISHIMPDLILTQSEDSERIFSDLGCKTEFLPSGVDIEKFKPVSKDVKDKLREGYGIDKGKFVILHVGSIKEGRGIKIFKKIALAKENQIIIIGNRSMGIEKDLYQDLVKIECKILVNYFENMEEIYALSDCYLFPTPPENKINSIEIPLSILEAMSCNLPVVTTKFWALPRVFEEGDGFFFVEEADFINKLEEIKRDSIEIKTREKVLLYSWKNITKKLERIYAGVVNGDVS